MAKDRQKWSSQREAFAKQRERELEVAEDDDNKHLVNYLIVIHSSLTYSLLVLRY